MSADNWTICPKCMSKKEDELTELEQQLKDEYGKISQSKYLELLEQYDYLLEIVNNNDMDKTLREDYEIGIRSGYLTINYRASCHACNFRKVYKYEEQV